MVDVQTYRGSQIAEKGIFDFKNEHIIGLHITRI